MPTPRTDLARSERCLTHSRGDCQQDFPFGRKLTQARCEQSSGRCAVTPSHSRHRPWKPELVIGASPAYGNPEQSPSARHGRSAACAATRLSVAELTVDMPSFVSHQGRVSANSPACQGALGARGALPAALPSRLIAAVVHAQVPQRAPQPRLVRCDPQPRPDERLSLEGKMHRTNLSFCLSIADLDCSGRSLANRRCAHHSCGSAGLTSSCPGLRLCLQTMDLTCLSAG